MLRSHRTFAATVPLDITLTTHHLPPRRRLDIPDALAPRELIHLRQAVLKDLAAGLTAYVDNSDPTRLPDPRDVSPATYRHVAYWIARKLTTNPPHKLDRRHRLETLTHYWKPQQADNSTTI